MAFLLCQVSPHKNYLERSQQKSWAPHTWNHTCRWLQVIYDNEVLYRQSIWYHRPVHFSDKPHLKGKLERYISTKLPSKVKPPYCNIHHYFEKQSQIIPQIGEADATEKKRRIDSSAIRGSSCCHWRCKGLITNLITPSHHNRCYHPHCLPTNRYHIIFITTLAKKLTFRWFSTSTRTANATKAGSNHF